METPDSLVLFSWLSTALGQSLFCSARLSWGVLHNTAHGQLRACITLWNTESSPGVLKINKWCSNRKEEVRSLTHYGVSIHVIEDVPKSEDPGGSSRWAAFEQRGSEFVPRLARVEVRVGFQRGAHAAGQRAHLIQSAAAFNLASIALHTHFLARKIQRREKGGTRDREIE